MDMGKQLVLDSMVNRSYGNYCLRERKKKTVNKEKFRLIAE